MNFKPEQWITWLGATVLACMTLSAFAFVTFDTKDNAKERSDGLEKRLSRMEDKLDDLLQTVKR